MEYQIQTIKAWLGNGSLNIFGLPFAGKDTQGKILAEMFDGVMISGGDILRHSQDNQELQQVMASGGIISSDLFEKIVVPYFSNPDLTNKPLILSEVGRLEGEQYVVERACESSGHPQKAVIMLTLSDEAVWQRFDISQQEQDRGKRADDNKNVLQTRLENYHSKVMPVINYYEQKNMLINIDGSLPKEQVTAEIINNLVQKI